MTVNEILNECKNTVRDIEALIKEGKTRAAINKCREAIKTIERLEKRSWPEDA